MPQTPIKLPALLILTALIVAPLLAGSYFGAWRWPAIFLITAAFFTHFTLPPKKISLKLTHSLPALTTLILCSIGYWMWLNSWGHFSRDLEIHGVNIPWIINSLENQPHPDLPGSPDKSEAWDRLSYLFPCLLLTLTVKSLILRGDLKLRQIATTIFLTGTAVAILGIIQRYTEAESIFWNNSLLQEGRTLFFGTYRSPGIATCYLNICLAIGLSHLLALTQSLQQNSNSKPTLPLLTIIGCLIILSGSIIAGSKAGATFAIITVILWTTLNARAIFHLARDSSKLLPSGSPHERNILLFSALTAAILATLSLGNTVTKRWERSQDEEFRTITKRQIANDIQLDMIKDEKWNHYVGYGPGSFYPLFPYYKGKKGDKLNQTWVYAHNDYLQTLVEWGIVGTSCFALLIGGGGFILSFEQFTKKKRHHKHRIFYYRGILIAMIVCLAHATVDFPFQIESIAYTFSALLGIAWATPTLRKKPRRRHSSSSE